MIPSNLGQSLAGVQQSEAAEVKEKLRTKTPARPRRQDEFSPATPVESPEAIRRLKGSTEEETREEREAHPEPPPRPPESPSIDVQA